MSSLFQIVLHAPEIPGNTGSIGRTCVALNIPLILIKPYGFSLDEKSVRRAGLDYWKYVQLREYEAWEEFLLKEKPQTDQMFFFSRSAKKIYYQAPFQKGCYLVFGSETKALPGHILQTYSSQLYTLPQYSEEIRSLNLANCATAAAYEALRQIQFA